jgi:lipopolysaccharide transport system permease protein
MPQPDAVAPRVDADRTPEVVTVIKPTKRWIPVDLKEVVRYRELLFFLAWRDIKARYKQSIVGAGWAIIQPLMSMIVFSVFFGRFAKIPSDGNPYPIFVYAGLLPWTFFATAVSSSGLSFVNNMNLLTKVYFPRILVPISALAVATVDFCIAFVIYLVLMAAYAVAPGWSFLMVPVLVAATMIAALGSGLALAVLTVRFRDTKSIIPFLMQLWMYATPVVYPISIVPERFQWMLALNPMAGVISGFRGALLNQPIAWDQLGISMGVSVFLLCGSMLYYGRMEREFADVI